MTMTAERLYIDEERASFAQERLWLLQQLDPSDSGYNLVLPIPLPAGTDAALFSAAMADMIERHDSLRTLFEDRDGVPWQCVLAPHAPAVVAHDFAALAPEAREEALAALIASEIATPFDLAAAPPLHCHHVDLGEAGTLAVIALHHIIADGWSMHLFARDLAEFSAAHLAARAPCCRRSIINMSISPPGSAIRSSGAPMPRSSTIGCARFRKRPRCSTCRSTGRARRSPRRGAAPGSSISRTRCATASTSLPGRRMPRSTWC